MVTFQVSITGKDMFDYNVYHNYRHFQGIISLLLGIVMLVVCVMAVRADGNISYILITGFLGLFFTVITPVRIYFKSIQQVKLTPSFRKPIRYTVSTEELVIEQDDAKAVLPMAEIVKAVDTGKSIVLYVSSIRAYIFPKRELGEQLPQVIETIKNSNIKKIKL